MNFFYLTKCPQYPSFVQHVGKTLTVRYLAHVWEVWQFSCCHETRVRSVTVQLLSRDTCEKCDSSAVITRHVWEVWQFSCYHETRVKSVTVQLFSRDMCKKCDSLAVVTRHVWEVWQLSCCHETRVRSVIVQLLSRSLRVWVLGMQEWGKKCCQSSTRQSLHEIKRRINNICLFVTSTAGFIGKDPRRGCHIHLYVI